ncbi:MAG: hypothetical protein HEQ16_09190 [Bosea sp.]|jgi:hypothetical protein|nr:hypothetical protein [Bosea sp. (in: a-proteobacteria)]
MSRMIQLSGQYLPRGAALFLLLAALGGCGDANLVRDAAQGVGLAGRPSETADFVRSSRADAPSGFMAVGVSAPPRAGPRRSAAEFRALEAGLEADKARLEAEGAAARQAGATPPAKPPVPVQE